MISRAPATIVLFLGIAVSFLWVSTPAPASSVLVITGATVVDGTGKPPIEDAVLVIEGDRISAVGPRSQVLIPRGAQKMPADGKWIIPGLIDAHVHFFQSAGLYTRPDVIDLRRRVPYEQELEANRRRLTYTFTRYLCSGVTAVVDVGGPLWNFEVREIAAETSAAPRVAVAGPLVSTYVPKELEGEDPPIIKVHTAEEARALVRREVNYKPDLIKIWFIHRPGQPLEELRPIVEATIKESHKHGIRVAVHATELETAKMAVQAGADILVHSVTEPIDEEFVHMAKAKDVIYTPTIVVWEGYREVLQKAVELTDIEEDCGDPKVIATWDDLEKLSTDSPRSPGDNVRTDVLLDNLRRLSEAGVIIAAGTDAGNIGTLHGPSIHREFELMAQAGLTPHEILVAATRNAARVFQPQPSIGTLEPGKIADLLILDANPLESSNNLRSITKIVKGGKIHDRGSFLTSP